MYNRKSNRDQVLDQLKSELGEILGAGEPYRVTDFTNYYKGEFSDSLMKQMFVFADPISLEELHKLKIRTNDMEFFEGDEKQENRVVNIDPGYLEPSKLVLFSTKDFSHRVYLGDGIFGEVTMLFLHGNFKILGWTYPDYYAEESQKFLKKMRDQIVSLARKRKMEKG